MLLALPLCVLTRQQRERIEIPESRSRSQSLSGLVIAFGRTFAGTAALAYLPESGGADNSVRNWLAECYRSNCRT